MSKRYTSGVVSSTSPTVNAAGASGVFTLNQQSAAQSTNNWPPYKIEKSLRFRSSASAYLSRTPASATNRKTWTWSAWVKRSNPSANGTLFAARTAVGATYFVVSFQSAGDFRIESNSETAYPLYKTNALFRDPSAWYHVVVTLDMTQATSTNRLKVWVNNVLQTTASYNVPAQNTDLAVNSTETHLMGQQASGNYFDGYMAEVNFIDGQALTPSSFGATDKDGNWSPISYTGTYGTNGFYLNFKDATSTSTVGYDYSGNGNNWASSGISVTAGATYDSMIDVPEDQSDGTANNRGNYCTINGTTAQPTGWNTTAAFSNGNLTGTIAAVGDDAPCYGTIALPRSGKWYWEVTISSSTVPGAVGIAESSMKRPDGTGPLARQLYSGGGTVVSKAYDGTNLTGSYTFFSNATLGVACDMDNGKLFISVSGTYVNSGDPVAGTGAIFTDLLSASPGGGSWLPMSFGYNGHVHNHNYGQRPFTYAPPSGFKTLNTFNLPEPTIKQPNKYFNAAPYTGTGATGLAVTTGHASGFVWIKDRQDPNHHVLFDQVRGVTKTVASNLTNAESTNSAGKGLISFDSNGFTLGTEMDVSPGSTNASPAGRPYAAWSWKANGTGVTNTAGSITSTVSANPTAGFSIVTYTGTGSNATIGHGLGVAPKMIIVKSRSNATDWPIYHAGMPSAAYYLYLQSTQAQDTAASVWNNTAPSSSVFSVGSGGTNTNGSGYTYVAYCFAEIAGYSAFGKYTGNGLSDGPFIYTGFRPKYYIIKNITNSQSWSVQDTSRNPYNVGSAVLLPNSSSAELTGTDFVDILSNGFKIRHTGASGNNNNSGDTYIYAAFAETPFKYARAR